MKPPVPVRAQSLFMHVLFAASLLATAVCGIAVEPAVLQAQSEELAATIASLQGEINEHAGYPVNPD